MQQNFYYIKTSEKSFIIVKGKKKSLEICFDEAYSNSNQHPSLTSHKIPHKYPCIRQPGHHTSVRGADSQRHGVTARLPFLEQSPGLQVVYYYEVGARLI